MGLLWAVVAVLLILWAIGAFVVNLGSLIHILLVVALIAIVWNLVAGRRSV